MKSDLEEKDRFLLECGCGCGMFSVSYFPDDMAQVFLGYSTPNFYSMQGGFFTKLRRAISMAFHILIGKEYTFYEIVIEEQKVLDDFKSFVANIKNIEENKQWSAVKEI